MSKVFDSYAAYYDLLYRDKDYFGEAEYVAGFIRMNAPEAKRILELGCGTGAHAEHFARMGYSVLGVDISHSMLVRAEQRRANTMPRDLAQRLRFQRGDVRDFRADNETFDVVLSLFHVFSYQIGNEDLQSAFKTAFASLKPGGILIFDFWYGPAVLTQRPDVRVRRLEDNNIEVLRLAEPVMYPNENRVQVNYTVQIKEKDGELQQIQESHNMRYLFLPEIEQVSSPYFKTVSSCGWMKSEQPGINDWAAVVVLQKLP